MAGSLWRQTADALMTITPICTAHDADGIDIHFLNHPQTPHHRNITSASTVREIFQTVRPGGATPIGRTLNDIFSQYLSDYQARPKTTKPINIICITDGVPTDDLEGPLIQAAKKLDIAWDEGDHGKVSSETILAMFKEGLEAKDLPAARKIGDAPGALASAAKVSLGSVSQTVRRLEQLDYVTKTRGTRDRRTVLFSLTDEGSTAVDASRRHRRDWLNGRLAALSPDELADIARVAPILLKLADS